VLKLYDFNAFTEDEKAGAVWSGSFLAGREDNGLMVQLYSVHSFYVEAFYDPAANKKLRFRAFTSRDLFVPYLSQINFVC